LGLITGSGRSPGVGNGNSLQYTCLGNSVDVAGYMESMWSQYGKDEYCKLADHGYRILAEAVETKPAYPIPCPVLLLCGTKDMAGSAKRYNRNWAKADGHTLIWLEGAGHNANTDAPNRVNALIEAFAAELSCDRS